MALLAANETLENEQITYEVSSIIDIAHVGEEIYYKVSYVGYGPDHDTWEPRENLNCDDALERFYKQLTTNRMMELQAKLGQETPARISWWSKKPRSGN